MNICLFFSKYSFPWWLIIEYWLWSVLYCRTFVVLRICRSSEAQVHKSKHKFIFAFHHLFWIYFKGDRFSFPSENSGRSWLFCSLLGKMKIQLFVCVLSGVCKDTIQNPESWLWWRLPSGPGVGWLLGGQSAMRKWGVLVPVSTSRLLCFPFSLSSCSLGFQWRWKSVEEIKKVEWLS